LKRGKYYAQKKEIIWYFRNVIRVIDIPFKSVFNADIFNSKIQFNNLNKFRLSRDIFAVSKDSLLNDSMMKTLLKYS